LCCTHAIALVHVNANRGRVGGHRLQRLLRAGAGRFESSSYGSAHNERKKLENMLATCARRQKMYRGIRGEAATTAHR
jgi:hypothetical protein